MSFLRPLESFLALQTSCHGSLVRKPLYVSKPRLIRCPSIDNQGSDTRRGVGIALLNFIGQCGPLLGTNVFPSSEGPRYIKGQAICAAFIFFNGFLALGLRCLLKWENKKLDEKYGSQAVQAVNRTGEGPQGKEDAVSEENYGPMFRYVL